MSDDEADESVLSRANEKGKFAVPLNFILGEALQLAFERGLELEWYTFIDLTPLANVREAGLARVFKLTPAGWSRLRELQAKRKAA